MIRNLLFTATAFVALSLGANAQSVTWTQDQIAETADGVTLTDANGYNIYPSGMLEGTLTAVEITATKVSGTTPAGELAIYITPDSGFALGGLLYAGGSSNAAIEAEQWYSWPNNDGTTISGTITLDTPIEFTATTYVRLVNLYLQETEATWDDVTVTLYGVSEFSGDYCQSFVAGPWTDFNNPENDWGGGAPTEEGQTHEITEFEVFASESYVIDGFIAGNEYTFSICNGAGAGSWDVDFTVFSPSGEVVAYGVDEDSDCSITWAATEDGAYIIGISEAGNCGVPNTIDNGYPAITNNGVASTENFAKLGLNVFPNPVSDIVNITSPEANIEAVTITDLNGRTVKSINFNNVEETTVDASDLASGIYLMNITANGTVATQKIVKK